MPKSFLHRVTLGRGGARVEIIIETPSDRLCDLMAETETQKGIRSLQGYYYLVATLIGGLNG